MSNAVTLRRGEKRDFLAGCYAVRVINHSRSNPGKVELFFPVPGGRTANATVLPGGVVEIKVGGLPFTATNKGVNPLTVQPAHRILITTAGVASPLLNMLWAAFNDQGFCVEPYTGPEHLLPVLPAVVYGSEPEYEQWAVAQSIRETLKNFGIQNVVLIDSAASDRDLTPGSFIVLPAGSAVALRALSCIQAYHVQERFLSNALERYPYKRNVMALINGTGWVEYGPENTKVTVSDSYIVTPPRPSIAYSIDAMEGTLVARFHRMMLAAGPINGAYVFTSAGVGLLDEV